MTLFKLCNPITVQQVDSPTHMRQLEEGALIFLEDAYASISGPPNVDAPITWEEERYRTLQNKLRQVEEELSEGKGYLIRLFALLAPQCKPLETLPGVATQIDNYIAGLKQCRDRLREALRAVLDGGWVDQWPAEYEQWKALSPKDGRSFHYWLIAKLLGE